MTKFPLDFLDDPEHIKVFVEEYQRIMKDAPEAIEWLAQHADPKMFEVVDKARDILERGFRSKLDDFC